MRIRALLPAALLLLTTGALAGDANSADKTETSKETFLATYAERVGRVEVIVGSQIAAVAAKEPYIPLQIAVSVWGKGPELEITPAFFLLKDAKGVGEAPASVEDVNVQFSVLKYAQAFRSENPLQLPQSWGTIEDVESNFYPSSRGDFYTTTHLHGETFLRDVLFFPPPEGGLEGVLTLELMTPGMEEPVFVKFEVPLRHEKTEKARKKYGKSDPE